MLTRVSYRIKRSQRRIDQGVHRPNRFVDMGVTLRVVRMDLANGKELLGGAPPLVVLREHRLGGIVDTARTKKHPRATYVGPSKDPTVWFCSEDQERILLHGEDIKPRLLVYGSEGAGKTATMAMWQFLRILETIGAGLEAGQTAPTQLRLKMFKDAAREFWHPRWYRFKEDAGVYFFHDGSRIQLVSTHQQSVAEGSRVQGFNWARVGSDELQDHCDKDADIEMRGRKAPGGIYRRFATATAKDSSEWRSFRNACDATGLWEISHLLALRSPFQWPRFWEEKKKTLDPREYRRRILAQDVGVELAVYYGWSRTATEHPTEPSRTRPGNLVRLPRIATDVTAAILLQYQSYVRPGSRFSLAIGHDPGNIYSTSVICRLVMFDQVPTWVVVGELQTKQTTAREHAALLRQLLQREFYCELPGGSKAAIFADPHGRGESQTDYQTVYMAFQAEGLDVFSPASITGRIKRTARVGMMNRVLCDAYGTVRCVVATDETGRPVAPVLVDAFESLEKAPGDDDPEGSQRKDRADKTHSPAALGYMLWPFEQEALTGDTVKRALQAARKAGF